MSYATLMVHLDLDRPNAGLLAIAGDMADRFHSRVVGIATGQPIVYAYGDAYGAGYVIEQNLIDIDKKTKALEAEFRAAFSTRNTAVEWRSTVGYGPLVDYVAAEARCADLILTRSPGNAGLGGPAIVNAGALVLQAGRPVLVVPDSTDSIKLDRGVICWRDTREARRAVIDSMDLLKLARAVDVVEVTTDDDIPACRSRLQDVVAWLALHGVSAEPIATPVGRDEKATLAAIIEGRDADFIVAGAYGHSRLHEWVLGGVTRNLWMDSSRCCLLSH